MINTQLKLGLGLKLNFLHVISIWFKFKGRISNDSKVIPFTRITQKTTMTQTTTMTTEPKGLQA